MMFNVPQYIDVEDKIAGPFTAKQLGWLFAMGGILLVFYGMFDTGLLVALGFPVVILFLAFAFYKPNGQSFSKFLLYAVLYVFRPKIAMWERPVRSANVSKITPSVENRNDIAPVKRVSVSDIQAIAQMVDGKR